MHKVDMGNTEKISSVSHEADIAESLSPEPASTAPNPDMSNETSKSRSRREAAARRREALKKTSVSATSVDFPFDISPDAPDTRSEEAIDKPSVSEKLDALVQRIEQLPAKTKGIAIAIAATLCIGASAAIAVPMTSPQLPAVVENIENVDKSVDKNANDALVETSNVEKEKQSKEKAKAEKAAAEEEARKQKEKAETEQRAAEEAERKALEEQAAAEAAAVVETSKQTVSLSNIPDWSGGAPYIEINGNVPTFEPSEINAAFATEIYAPLDNLGRCQYAFAVVGRETQPTTGRGDISSIKPTGWQQNKYDGVVSGGWLYNRCHLIGHQLTAENANRSNLITGTKYLNIEGMLPFENKVADYIDNTGNHVLYRATPIFASGDLLCRGVHMMGKSIEDNGQGVSFNVFCYNVQPGIAIDYATGANHAVEAPKQSEQATPAPTPAPKPAPAPTPTPAPETKPTPAPAPDNSTSYILNTSTHKYHKPDCHSADKIAEKNKQISNASTAELESQGYTACKNCFK